MCHSLIKLMLMAFLVIVTLTMDCELESNDKYKAFTDWKNYTGETSTKHQIYCRIGNKVMHTDLVKSDKHISGYDESGYYTFFCSKPSKNKLTIVKIEHNSILSSLNLSDLCEPRICQQPDSKLNVISKCNPVCKTGNYDCMSGYTMKPDHKKKLYLYCNKTNGGMLAEQPGKCTANFCSKKPDESAFHIIVKSTLNQTGEYECIDGYLPAHPSSDNYTRMNCINDSWTSENACVPVCQIAANNGRHLQELEGKRANSSVLVTCERNYQDKQSTKGSFTIEAKCMNGEFVYEGTTQNVECVSAACGDDPTKLNFHIVGKPAPYHTGKYDCITDYLPTYPSTDNDTWLYCINNTWNVDEPCKPVCQIVSYNEAHLKPVEKTRENSTVKVTCERGYKDSHSTKRSITINAKCMNGTFVYENTSQPVECVPETCTKKLDDSNTDIVNKPAPYQTGKYECLDGYLPAHPSSDNYTWLYCNNDVWSIDEKCQPVCKIPANNGKHLQALEGKRDNSTVTVTCERGYQDINSKERSVTIEAKCIFTHIIRKGGSELECVEELCFLPAPTNLFVQIDNQTSGKTGLIMPCQNGYAPPISKGETNSIELLCYNNVWEGRNKDDLCLRKCNSLTSEAYEQFTGETNESFQHGRQAEVVCRSGYKINNTTKANVVCDDGIFLIENTDVQAMCEPVRCSKPPNSQDLHIVPSNILLSGVTVSCADDYAPSIKHPTVDIRLVCEFNMWKPFRETDVCLPLCPLLKHGSAEQQQRLREGQSQMSKCINGFVLNTSNTTHCYNGSLIYEDVSGNRHSVICQDESLLAEQNSESQNHKDETKNSWLVPVIVSITVVVLIILIIIIICIVRRKKQSKQQNISENCDKLMQLPESNEEDGTENSKIKQDKEGQSMVDTNGDNQSAEQSGQT